MFLIFINDLPLVLENFVSSIKLYTDDTTIYDIQSDIQILETNLQDSLKLLHKWVRENGKLLNTDKTKVMLLTARQKRLGLQKSSLSLNYNDLDLKLTSNKNVLGVHIEENLTWNVHFQLKETFAFFVAFIAIKSFLSIEVSI